MVNELVSDVKKVFVKAPSHIQIVTNETPAMPAFPQHL